MGEPLVRFPVVCPDCLKEHLASVPIEIIAAALADKCRNSGQATHHASFGWDATEAGRRELHEYLAAIIRCPPHQSRFSAMLRMTGKQISLVGSPTH